MSGDLLQTKLYIPPLRPNLVPRARLIEQLNQGLGLGCRLTLISAPAGFGKTTLLVEWANDLLRANNLHQRDEKQPAKTPSKIIPSKESEIGIVWVSLDEGDNDLIRFLTYLVAALQTVVPALGEDVLSLLQSPGMINANPPLLTTEILTTLINQVNVSLDDHPSNSDFAIIVVLDDYHFVTTQSIHDAIAFLLDHLPSRMHLVIATRADPPLPIARLRGRGQLSELRQADLYFTSDEVREFLQQATGLLLSAEDLLALASRTEGWIAGLQMAAVSMRSRKHSDDVTAFIHAFTGSNRYILDYLVEEVLGRQSDSVQTFLLETAILNRLNGPLCDAITRQANSQEILEKMERANLFIIPLDDERHWYRYHRLFADLLRKRLREQSPEKLPMLHRKASAWHEKHNFMGEAIDHALAAGDFDLAADLVEQSAEAILSRSETSTFSRWVKRLPDEQIRTRSMLALFQAWVLLLNGHLAESEAYLKLVDSKDELVLSRATTISALLAGYQGEAVRAIELSHQALSQLPDNDFFRFVAAWHLSSFHFMAGDRESGAQALDEVARMSQASGNVMVAVSALCRQAALYMLQGRLRKAETIFRQAQELATDKQRRPLPIASEALIGLGKLARERGELKAAADYLQEGIELSRRWRELIAVDGYVTLARVRQAQGNMEGANDAIHEAREQAAKSDALQMDDLLVEGQQARLSLLQGDLESAVRWAESRGWDLAEPGNPDSADLVEKEGLVSQHLRKYESLLVARIMIAQSRPEPALALLTPLLVDMQKLGRIGIVINIYILRALALHTQGEIDEAIIELQHALTLAKPEGYVRAFVDEGEPMARLLYKTSERGILPGFVGKLLAAFGDLAVEQEPEIKGSRTNLIEPLSQRETEILKLIAEGLTNREIAQRLYIAPGTVKVHTYKIYGKLGVHSRTHAVAQARTLGILSST